MTAPSETPDQAAAWWFKLGSQTDLSRQDEVELEAWLAESDQNGAALRRYSDVWSALEDLSDAPEIVSRRADALEAMRQANRRRWSKPFRLPKVALAMAASVAALIGVGTWYLVQGDEQRLATAIGERRAMVLADGSHVSMDAKTRVSIAIDQDQRRLHIDGGRARFEVAYQPDRPFTVEANGHVVIATGTNFSTELVGGELRVIVYEGKVAVLKGAMPDPQTLLALRRHPGNRAVSLIPGQELIARGATTVVRRDAPGSSSWESGQLEFVDEPLGDAVEQLNRYSDHDITVTDQRAAGIRINGIFKAGNSAAFLDAVTRMYPVTIHHGRGGGIEITSST